ncbi:MAG: nicotinate (nicotinamide) nucleotide adenylyltransferase [Erysipelotrichaceae bacterium]|nr:nicotinate (nicotinamide) nucleotide adenylyltransferase [Erysipelotrichaceae bacterium]
MRIGVYCGSFNPVHKGHIKIVREVLKKDLADKVLIVPTGNYWDKQNLPPVVHRIKMLRYFENDNIMIDDVHNDIQYTYQLFRALREEHPEDQFILIIGRDNIPTFDRWKEYKELLQYDFIIIPREDIDSDDLESLMKGYGKSNYTILPVRNINFSSSFIRQNIDDYEKIRYCTDKRVYNYMKKHVL